MRKPFAVLVLLVALAAALSAEESPIDQLNRLVRLGDVEKVAAFIDANEGIAETYTINSPLITAIGLDDMKMVALLLKRGFPTQIEGDMGDYITVLTGAIREGKVKQVAHAVEAGVKPDIADLFACDNDARYDLAVLFMEKGLDPLERKSSKDGGGGFYEYSYVTELARGKAPKILAYVLDKHPAALKAVSYESQRLESATEISQSSLLDLAKDPATLALLKGRGAKSFEALAAEATVEECRTLFRGETLKATSKLKVRDQPGLKGRQIGLLLEGESVVVLKTGASETIDGITGYWSFVKGSGGATGWAFGGYLAR